MHLGLRPDGDGTPSRSVERANALFHLAAMNRGVYLSARGLMSLSTVLGEAELREAKDRLSAAIGDVAGELA
jgi:hypothetical protein